jgi:DNA-binding MarR family transcriptional regulator
LLDDDSVELDDPTGWELLIHRINRACYETGNYAKRALAILTPMALGLLPVHLYRYLVNVLALRLRESVEAMAAASFLPVKARLARVLLEVAEYLGEKAGAGRVLIRHKFSQSDLAAMTGLAREDVSRVLSDWKQRKLVTRSSGYYCLNDIATLKRHVDRLSAREYIPSSPE